MIKNYNKKIIIKNYNEKIIKKKLQYKNYLIK